MAGLLVRWGWAQPVYEREGCTGRRHLNSGPAQCRSHGHMQHVPKSNTHIGGTDW